MTVLLQSLDEPTSPSPRIVPASWGLLAAAFSDDTAGVRWYLHTETGEIVRVVESTCTPGAHLEEGFVGIERARSKEQYRWMQRYIAGLGDPALAAELSRAIAGKLAFHRFRAALAAHPGRAAEWLEFRSGQLLRYMHAWLQAQGIVVPHDASPALFPRGDEEPVSPAAGQRGRLDAVVADLTVRELESVLALAEMLRLDARARGGASGVRSL